MIFSLSFNEIVACPDDPELIDERLGCLHLGAAGKLWQLDGRRAGPVCHGPTSPDTLLQDTVAVVKQFIERTNSLNFNLITLSAVDAADNV
jgi:ubiquitin carboxyl-terminal hydrolase L3